MKTTKVQTTKRHAYLQMKHKRAALDKIGEAVSAKITLERKTLRSL